ncbi:MAG: reverse transcriptase domain-containing protein [Candidatus Moraniibacteriota bacterium]
MQNLRYPKLFIRSKNELAKHISHKNFSKEDALLLINEVLENFDKYWKDSKHSEPKKQKYIRNAKFTKLGLLLQKINTLVIAPHDKILPKFIFGGVKNTNHAKAAQNLLGSKRKRTLLKIDLERFFEQISDARVFDFFKYKCSCDIRASKILAQLCCVPLGQKNSGAKERSIARGFATSQRLAVWCNLDIFIKLDRLVQKKLKGHDPRISIYVDDIGITASRVTEEKMNMLKIEIKKLLLNTDANQKLKINEKKTEIISHEDGIEYVGINLFRNKLGIGKKAKSKRDEVKEKLKKDTSQKEKLSLKRRYKSMNIYKNYIENISKAI